MFFCRQQQMAAAHSEPQSRAGLSSTHQPRGGGLEATGRGFCPAAAAEVWWGWKGRAEVSETGCSEQKDPFPS